MLLVEQLSDDTLNAVHSPLMSPIVWDLGHIATFEDLWLAHSAFGEPMLRDGLGDVYDPNAAPRSERGGLPFLRSEDAFRYMDEVRARVLGAAGRGRPLAGQHAAAARRRSCTRWCCATSSSTRRRSSRRCS